MMFSKFCKSHQRLQRNNSYCVLHFNFVKYLFIPALILLNIILSSLAFTDEDGIGVYEDGKEFCYNDPECGPRSSLWNGVCQTGTQQSPILLPNYGPPLPGGIFLHLNSYRGKSFRMRNNGHTVQVELLDQPGLNGSKPVGLSRYQYEDYASIDYRLDTAHFHWGSEDGVGSEHLFEGGRRFSMELHLVHFRSNYSSTRAALDTNDPNALSVIGIMLNVTQSTSGQGNSQLAPIVQNLPKFQKPSQQWTYISQPVDFTSFLPSLSQNHMHSYKGSLTTPECDEKVNWYVYNRPVPISHDDIQQFRTLENNNGENLSGNYRPLEPRSNRTVFLTTVGSM